MKRIYLLSAGLVLSGTAYAELGQEGLGGELSALVGFGGEKNNLSTEEDTVSKNSSGKNTSSFSAMPLGELRYTFGDENDQQVYFGTARNDIIDGIFALEIGYAFEFDDESVLSIGYLPTISSGDVWKDPYNFSGKRQTTEKSGNTYRIQYENILSTSLSADFAYYDQDIKEEASASHLNASQQKQMRRDGKGYYLSLSSPLPLSEDSFIEPSILYHSFSADGNAMSFNKYGAALSYLQMVDRHSFSLSAEYSYKEFDASNPVFNKKQKDNNFSLTAGYEYDGIFDMENLAFSSIVSYNAGNSNIQFYDTSDYLFGVGFTYKF